MLTNEVPMLDDNPSSANIQTVLHWLRNLSNPSNETVSRIIREIESAQSVNAIFDGELRNTPLRLAVIGDEFEVVGMLLQNGADVSLVDKFGNTPLHYAALAENNKMMRLLQRQGASDAVSNYEGITAGEIREVNRHNFRNQILVESTCVCAATTAACCICNPKLGFLVCFALSQNLDLVKKDCLTQSAQKTLFFQKELLRRTPPAMEAMEAAPAVAAVHASATKLKRIEYNTPIQP